MKLKTSKVTGRCPFCAANDIESTTTMLVIRRETGRSLYEICDVHATARADDPQTELVDLAAA